MSESSTNSVASDRQLNMNGLSSEIVPYKHRYPHSIVWTPLPLITWIIPFIGHMGIAYSSGIIRDFAGPYTVTEDEMAFGWPTKYWQLDISKHGPDNWDRAIRDASEEYKKRMHNLCCDNCHSHVAYALNLMEYGGSSSWNMVKLCFLMMIHSRFVGISGFLKTWAPFLIIVAIITTITVSLKFHAPPV